MTANSVPAWVEELLRVWADSDRAQAHRDLGYPSVAPMWRGVADSGDELELTGYSPLEVRAVVAGVEWLQAKHPEHWRALCRRWRPWTQSTLPAGPDDAQLVREACLIVAAYVDRTVG